MLEGNVLYLVLGIAIGVLLTAKSVKDVVGGLPEAVVPYTLFGFLLFGATAALSWAGFTCVAMAFVLYHAVGREGWSQTIRTFFSFKWLRRKKTTTTDPEPETIGEAAAHYDKQVDEEVLQIITRRSSPVSKQMILVAIPAGMVDQSAGPIGDGSPDSPMLGESLTRLLAANKIKADENGLYTVA